MPEIVLDGACPLCAKCCTELNTPKQTVRRHAFFTFVAFSIVVVSLVMIIAGFATRPHADLTLGVIGCGFVLLGIVALGNWFGLLMSSIKIAAAAASGTDSATASTTVESA